VEAEAAEVLVRGCVQQVRRRLDVGVERVHAEPEAVRDDPAQRAASGAWSSSSRPAPDRPCPARPCPRSRRTCSGLPRFRPLRVRHTGATLGA
jgi:hypothetical protein